MEHTMVDCHHVDELLHRIEQFDFDEHQETLLFSARLAAEHAWSRDHVARVIREYKRFAFLAVVTDHAVTPSDDVDQAWHQHLVYSESYWLRFCGEVLCQPLHHRPASGDRSDGARYRAAYERTLASYRLFFGEAPPADIWPEPDRRFDAPGWVRVRSRDHWIVPRPAWWPTRDLLPARARSWSSVPSRITAWAQASIAAAWASIGACSGQLELAGDQFLMIYLGVWASCLISACVVRYRWRRPHNAPSSTTPPALDAYDSAYLAGGPPLAVDAAIAALVHRQVLALDDGEDQLRRGPVEPLVLHPVERLVYAGLRLPCDQREVARLRTRPHPALQSIADRLEQDALTCSTNSRMRWLPAIIATFPQLACVAALVAGLGRAQWLGAMPIFCLITVWVSLRIFYPTIRTAFGDRTLAQSRTARADLRALFAARLLPPEGLHAVPLAVGLFSLDVLAGTELGVTARWLVSEPVVDMTCGHGCD